MLCSADNYALLDLPFSQFTEDLGLYYVKGRKKKTTTNKWNTYSGIRDYYCGILRHIFFSGELLIKPVFV